MCKLTHFKNRQIANTLQSISVSVLVSATHLQEDSSQLVVVWLYSNINARLPSTYAVFGINCHHAATKSLLIESFLSLFQIYEVLMNFCVWRWQQILTNLSKLMSVITNRQHVITNLFPFHHKLIADWLGLIAILLPSWHTKVALKGAADCEWLQTGPSVRSNHFKGSKIIISFYIATVILDMLQSSATFTLVWLCH